MLNVYIAIIHKKKFAREVRILEKYSDSSAKSYP